jgi:hypothetical protein
VKSILRLVTEPPSHPNGQRLRLWPLALSLIVLLNIGLVLGVVLPAVREMRAATVDAHSAADEMRKTTADLQRAREESVEHERLEAAMYREANIRAANLLSKLAKKE